MKITLAPDPEPPLVLDQPPLLRLLAAPPQHSAHADPPPAPVPLVAPPTTPPGPVVEPAARVGATRVLQLALEVENGRRSPALLRPLLSPAALDRVIARAQECVRSRPHPGRLHPVHTQAVTPDVVEAFARVSRGPRDHAAVARLERGPTGWICTTLRLG